MNTRAKNKLAHPAACVMTPAQLSAAGISQPQQKRPRKKQTKDQQIAALQEDLRATQELLQTVFARLLSPFRTLTNFLQNHPTSTGNISGMASELPDDGGDTEPATEEDDDYVITTGRKRISQRPSSAGVKYVELIIL
jgi:hypothetical protein